MSRPPASRARALVLVLLVLPFAALASLPTASAAAYWTEDWETGTDGWSLTGGFAKQDCSVRLAGSCSLKLDPPCTPGGLVTYAHADYPDRSGNGLALSFAMKAALNGDTKVWVDVDLRGPSGQDVGGLKANVGWGGGMNVQLFSEGGGASSMPSFPASSWYIVSLRMEPSDGTAWVDVWSSAGGHLTSTTKVKTPANAQASDVRVSASTPIDVSDPTCTARAFWFDNVRLGDSLADRPDLTGVMATRTTIGLSFAPADPGTVPVTSYRVWRSMDNGPETEVGSTTTTSYTDSNLQAGSSYTYRVRARNGYGDSDFSFAQTAVTWGFGEEWEDSTLGWDGAPGAGPDCVIARSGCGVSLTPSTGYTELSHVFNQFMTGRFQASFWYRATPGPSPMDARLAATYHGPTWAGTLASLHLTGGADGLGVRVQSGSVSAALPISPAADTWTRVALVLEPQGDVAWAEALDADGNVLAASTTVPIQSTVDAISRLTFAASTSGPSPGIVRVDSLRTGYLPASPTNLDGAGAFRSAHLTWVKPSDLGSGTLTGYRVYRAPQGGVPQPVATLGAGTTSFTDSGLADDASYEYSVAAITTSGVGPRSGAKLLHTDRVSEGFESGLGAWTVSDPASAGVSCATAHAGSCSVRVAPTARGTQVDAVRALDSKVTGSFTASAWIHADRAPAATDATFRLAFEDGKSVDVEFLRSGATASDTWRIRMGSTSWLFPAPGLSANAWHEVRLHVVPDGSHVKAEIRGADGRVVASSGPFYFPSGFWTGADLAAVGVHVKHAAAGSTAILHVDDVRVHDTLMSRPSADHWKRDRGVGVSWWGHSGPTAVTGVRVYAGLKGTAMQKITDLAPTATTYTVRNLADGSALVNGQTYCVTVGILTAYGESPTSEPGCVVPQALPDAPTGLKATSGANKVTLTWNAPAYPGDPAMSQTCIDRRTNTHTSPPIEIGCVSASQKTYTDGTAVGGVRYYYTVRAVNTAGSSSDSNMVLGQPTLT